MTRWKVGLSNGENFTEGNEPFEEVSKQNSPWLKLQDYIKNNQLEITSLSLVDGSRTFNLPSAGKNPKFHAFYSEHKPLFYNFHRVIGLSKSKNDLFARIQAVYKQVTLELWVDENNTKNCWVQIK